MYFSSCASFFYVLKFFPKLSVDGIQNFKFCEIVFLTQFALIFLLFFKFKRIKINFRNHKNIWMKWIKYFPYRKTFIQKPSSAS